MSAAADAPAPEGASAPDEQRSGGGIWVVGIGSSAGGLEALQEVVRRVSTDLPAAILVSQHLAPRHKSLLAELLGRQASVTVVVAQDGVPPRPGTVHVCPPNADLVVRDGVMRLLPPALAHGPRPSVDSLFSSLAVEYKDRAVGIVLSGTGSDGTYGLREIQAVGGFTVAQDPATAKYESMPRAAIDAGIVDRIVAPDAVGSLLEALVAGQVSRESVEAHVPEPLVRRILSALHSQIGVDYSEYKEATIQRQIARRMAVLQISEQDDYLTYLLADRVEARILSKNMLVSVTSFYRDPPVWDQLATTLADELRERPAGEPIRIWVPGCATGEEAYTLLMLFGRAMGYPEDLGARIKIFATDLDDAALDFARRGTYPAASAQQLPADLREQYTTETGSNVVIRPIAKEAVVFARHNLATDPPFLRVDLVSCRNLLIYFEPDLQEQVLRTIHYALKPGGLMVLGAAEGVGPLGDVFPAVTAKRRIYRRSARSLEGPRVPSRGSHRDPGIPGSHLSRRGQETQALRELLLSTLAPPTVVVNDSGGLVQVLGEVSRFCQLPEGHLDLMFTSIVRPALLPEARRLMVQASVTGESATGIPIDLRDGYEPVRVVARPASNSFGTFLMVSFTDATEARPIEESAKALMDSSGTVALQAELDNTRVALQATIEQLETSNEELQAMNEEMMASGEEMQASNEELETINEELQASNEELGTINEELQVRSRELAEANLDLSNIQDALSHALVLVDRHRRVTRYSPLAVRLFVLVEDDIGAPIDRVVTTAPLPDLAGVLEHVMVTGTTEILAAQGGEGEFQVVISAWKNESGEVGGAILSVNDIAGTQAARHSAAEVDDELILASQHVASWTRSGADGSLISVGAEAVEFLGVSHEVLSTDQASWLTNVVAEDLVVAESAWALDRPQRVQYRTVVDGRMRTVVDLVQGHLHDDLGEIVGSIWDAAEAAPLARASKDAAAVTSAFFAMPGRLTLQTTRQGEVLRVGEGTQHYLGVPSSHVIGRRLQDLCLTEDRESLARWLAGLSESGSELIEVGFVNRDGIRRRQELKGASLLSSRGTDLLVMMRDVTDERSETEALRSSKNQDALTGLSSRSALSMALDRELDRSMRDTSAVAVMWLDLDGFKDINDRHGHRAGDLALTQVSQRLNDVVRGGDMLARVGGDEFCLVVRDFRHLDQLEYMADRLLHALRAPLDLGSATCHVTGSIGIALYPNDADTAADLQQAADTAMYAAKADGGDRFRFHQSGMHADTEARAELRHELAQSIRDNAFVLHYQPIFRLTDNSTSVYAAEALIRRVRPDRSVEEAAAFIEAAEHSGQIRSLGRLVWRLLARDRDSGLPADLPVAINMSAAELNDPSLPAFLRQAEVLDLVPGMIIEVTEHLLLQPRSVGMQTVGLLRSMGARIWVDDYGSGFSNMTTLEQLDPELLKIDKTFTDLAARGDRRGIAFLEAARRLAESLDCRVVAEGVESEKHLQVVRDAGITLAQGYHLARPTIASALADSASV